MQKGLTDIHNHSFYSFDSEMRYQYKANGIQTIALRRIGNREKTISPYSTYLSLCICSSAAMKNLHELENRGMITHEHYGAIILTAQGKAAYEKIKFKHDSLKRYLTDVLGVSEETADKDACAMEHIISDETFGKIVNALGKS